MSEIILISHKTQIKKIRKEKNCVKGLSIGWCFSLLFQLTQENDTVLLGIILLQTASEELAVPREDLSMARKDELQKLLLQQVPTVLSLLNSEFCYLSTS